MYLYGDGAGEVGEVPRVLHDAGDTLEAHAGIYVFGRQR